MTNRISYLKEGDIFFQNGRYKDAIKIWKKCLNDTHEPSIYGIRIGLTYYKIGKRREGQEYLEKFQKIGVRKELLKYARKLEIYWPGLSESKGRLPSQKNANIFFLTAITDYQINAERHLTETKKFVQEKIPDPKNLWQWITAHSFNQWKGKWKAYHLHPRFPEAHNRVWKIGKIIIERYGGDARKIWKNQSPKEIETRIYRLVGGKAIPRMILGALYDNEQIASCTLDVKPDVHVVTVLFRLLFGSKKVIVNNETINDTIAITRQIYPKNPWKLDAPLYRIGLNYCTANSPQCSECPLKGVCVFYYGVHLKKDNFN